MAKLSKGDKIKVIRSFHLEKIKSGQTWEVKDVDNTSSWYTLSKGKITTTVRQSDIDNCMNDECLDYFIKIS